MPTIPNLEVQQADGSYAVPGANQYRMAVVLAAGTEEIITVPQDDDHTGTTNFVFFAAEAPFYADYTKFADETDVEAAIPAANIEDGTAPDFSPTTRRITNVEKISLISRTDQVVTLTFFL